jgi:DNA-binding PadR family transcriptional regulator
VSAAYKENPISDLLILEQLAAGPKYPYQIIKGITTKFNTHYRPSTGVIYPSLTRLLEKGYVRKEKRNYSITEEGLEFYQSQKESFESRLQDFRDNKIFIEKFHEAIKRVSRAIYLTDRDFIERNKEKILSELNKVADNIENQEWD